jgi:CRISPR-associated protein Cas1
MGEQLIIDVPGVFLGKTGERIVARKGKEAIGETPLDDVETLLIEGHGITISSDLVEACAMRGIQINFTDFRGDPIATFAAPAFNATVQTRRQQLAAYGDVRGALAARSFVTAKLRNQANLLKYFGKYRRSREPTAFVTLADAASSLDELAEAAKTVETSETSTVDTIRPSLMNIEGRGGAIYWASISVLLDGKFARREHRGAEDPINQALNYGYGILYGAVQRAVLLAGLDPFGGFLHVDRPGKPSLVLDLVEEFRQPVVDRALLALIGRGMSLEQESGTLTQKSRRAIADAVTGRLNNRELVRADAEYLSITSIITRQARRLAGFLRGERSYIPYISRW